MVARVRVNSVYTFIPGLVDLALPQHYRARKGQRVRVIQLPGAPKANTMGHCHIEDADTGEFLGIVSTDSLVRVN